MLVEERAELTVYIDYSWLDYKQIKAANNKIANGVKSLKELAYSNTI